MRISDVKTYILGTAWRNLTYVEVHTDDGLVGVGEVRMLNHSDALIGYLAEAVPNHVLSSDPFQVEDLVARMFRNDYARAGEIAMSAISTLEMACLVRLVPMAKITSDLPKTYGAVPGPTPAAVPPLPPTASAVTVSPDDPALLP